MLTLKVISEKLQLLFCNEYRSLTTITVLLLSFFSFAQKDNISPPCYRKNNLEFMRILNVLKLS